jgi:DNA (cytosine-5)-methyltransferase 1
LQTIFVADLLSGTVDPHTVGVNRQSKQATRSASPTETRPHALDFFAGSGLAAEALRPFFAVVWANDISEKKAATYRANHPGDHFHLQDLAEVRGSDLPGATLSWASFPCQDLSLAGNLGGIGSARSGMVWHWLRAMDEMNRRPPLVVAENVVGLVSAGDGKHYLALHTALRARGYRVGVVVLDAIHWLPHSRPRVFVVAVDRSVDIDPHRTSGPTWCHPAAIVRVASRAEGFVWWSLPVPTAKRRSLAELIDYDAPADDGKQAKHNLGLIPEHHRKRMHSAVNGHATVFPGYKRTRYGRQVLELRFDNIAGCLRTPAGGSSRQLLVIYKDQRFETRLLTVRETARLMGVREGYRIVGTYNDGYKAMGDAVAVPAVRHLARHLLAPLADGARS